MKNPIIFYKGDENGIVVEKNYYEYSLFTDQYKKAFEVFNRIWKTQEPMIDTQGEKQDSYRGMDNRFSNIISFCGDRGEGKSSCMSSFTAMLTEQEARKSAVDSMVVDAQFVGVDKIELIDFIDPSFFDEQHNVLELLLGRMYTSVNRINTQNKNYEAQLYNIRQLREQFQKVKTSLAILHKKDEKNYLENLEELDELAAGIRLKAELDELFRLYLEFVNKKRILICIDDMDLNMSQGYKMAELVRKYLIGKYCIILVSVKVEQLVDIVAIAMRNELGKDNVSLDYCQLMAQKYVVKLLPQSNRVFMPSPTDFCEVPFALLDDKKVPSGIDETFVPIKEYVVRLIYKKTGYVFYNTQSLSPIIPLNLRSLRHLIATLSSIVSDAVEYDSNENKIDHEEGREAFKEYFFNSWATILPGKDYEFAQRLAEYEDLSTLNKFIVDYFSNRVTEEKLFENATAKSDNEGVLDLYKRITNKSNVASNISLGDVMFVLWCVDKITMNVDIKNLIFLLRSFYSMRIYSCYNRISVNEKTLYPLPDEKDKDVTIHKSDSMYDHVNDLQRVVNGSFFTYVQSSILPSIGSTKYSRDRRIISLKTVAKLFDDLKKDYANASMKESTDFSNKLKLCEYIALCTTRVVTNDEKIADLGLNRTTIYPTYLGEISITSNYLMFDIMAPFYSLCNIRYAYDRFDSILNESSAENSVLYSIAEQVPDSLLNSLYKVRSCESLSTWEKQHHLISDAVIRVMDIQWSIMDALSFKKDKYKSDADEAGRIILAYDEVRKLKVTLYPIKDISMKGDVDSAYKITFDFLDVLSKCLDEVKGTAFNEVLKNPGQLKDEDNEKNIQNLLAFSQLNSMYPATGAVISKILSGVTTLSGGKKGSLTKQLIKYLKSDKEYKNGQDVINVLAPHYDEICEKIKEDI